MNPGTESSGCAEASSGGPGPETQSRSVPPNSHPSESIREAASKLGELREFAAYYVAARVDAFKASVRRAGIYAALGLIGAVGGATLVIVAIVLLLLGCAQGLGALFGGRLWLGYIVTGAAVLLAAAIGIIIGSKVITRMFHRSTVSKYENRQRQQRQRFGRSVGDEATAAERASRAA